MESTENPEPQEQPKKHACTRPCCQCKPVRLLRNACLENNGGDESKCIDFVNAFKTCIAAKRAEAAALQAQTRL